MTGSALLQLKASVDESWLDHPIIGIYFLFGLGLGAILRIGAILRNNMRPLEDYFPSGRSLASRVTGLALLGTNLGAIEILGMSWASPRRRAARNSSS